MDKPKKDRSGGGTTGGKTPKPAPSFIADHERDAWRALHGVEIKPLKNQKPRASHLPKPVSVAAIQPAWTRTLTRFEDLPKTPALVATPSRAVAPELSPLTKKQRRKIARGHRDLDARIDLHGMRQEAAHAALKKFLRHSAMEGHRNVLVITGKGSVSQPSVLRDQLPRWLNGDADLAPLILSLTPAAPQHGGAGAFYVELRKLR